MLTFYAAVFVLVVVETFATLLFGLSSEMERSILHRRSTLNRETVWAHCKLALRIAFRFALGILIAVRIIQLTG